MPPELRVGPSSSRGGGAAAPRCEWVPPGDLPPGGYPAEVPTSVPEESPEGIPTEEPEPPGEVPETPPPEQSVGSVHRVRRDLSGASDRGLPSAGQAWARRSAKATISPAGRARAPGSRSA